MQHNLTLKGAFLYFFFIQTKIKLSVFQYHGLLLRINTVLCVSM
jgi:hypothetical protein